ncbi:MAG: serine/threonine protein kinase [Vicinamibacteria bacterium]|nr:serine/threonine protein kinase [Vicinamibacteria bacterium]
MTIEEVRSWPAASTDFPYDVEAIVGEGGMGVVYRAVEPALGRFVAVKRLRSELLGADPEAAADARQRFLREARAAAALSHPGVATIYRVGEDASGPWIAMEWLDGDSLESLIAHRRLSARVAVLHVVALLEALDAAHQAGVVHRDIKPANLIVLKDGRLKVTDFGIARLRGGDMFKTQAGVVLASPRFASPEQMLGDEVDGRSDLFSTGVVLYLALTGEHPFPGRDYVEVVGALMKGEPLPPSAHAPALPPALDAIVLKALARERDSRYATGAEMAAALRELLPQLDAVPGPAAVAGPTSSTVTSPRASATTMLSTTQLRGLPNESAQLVARVISSWPARDLGRQPVTATLERLLEPPLHAEPFAGAVVFGRTFVLVDGGRVVDAFDPFARRTGDDALAALPAEATCTIHTLASDLQPAILALFSTLLRPPRVRQAGLDSAFVNLPALAQKLTDERFAGLLRLRRGEAFAFVFLADGAVPASVFTAGWDDCPLERPWQDWIGSVGVQASVEERNPASLLFTWRRDFRDAAVAVAPGQSPAARLSAPRADGPAVEGDPAWRLLRYLLEDLSPWLRERGRAERWKYLVEWLGDVRAALLHHDLEQPGGAGRDNFDLVTFDDKGKVLHLAHLETRVTRQDLTDFVAHVTAAKKARIRGGDVGAAVLVASSFDPAAITAYRRNELGEASGGWGIEEALTRYEGFVRIGPRRGFHLLLVTDTGNGFEPILPA